MLCSENCIDDILMFRINEITSILYELTDLLNAIMHCNVVMYMRILVHMYSVSIDAGSVVHIHDPHSLLVEWIGGRLLNNVTFLTHVMWCKRVVGCSGISIDQVQSSLHTLDLKVNHSNIM